MLEKDRPASLKPHPGGREGRTSQEVGHTTEVSLDGQPWPWVEALVTTLLQGALQFSRCTLKVTETQAAACITHVLTVHEHGGHQGWSPRLVLLPQRRTCQVQGRRGCFGTEGPTSLNVGPPSRSLGLGFFFSNY